MTTPNPAYSDPTLEEGRFSGLYPDNTYPEVDGEPDIEQQKRLQARQESARTPRVSSENPYADHPPFATRGPDAAPVLGVINPTAPTYNDTTDVLTIPTEANVSYYNITDPAAPVLLPAGDTTLTVTSTVEARPAEGYRMSENTTTQWTYTV